ncbi:hypothetical protein FACS1894137_16320 [Spirochaetia bacterium]|nr:hypothetical protein FACS1894137_16320 [Spirochaetia bacterium]
MSHMGTRAITLYKGTPFRNVDGSTDDPKPHDSNDNKISWLKDPFTHIYFHAILTDNE